MLYNTEYQCFKNVKITFYPYGTYMGIGDRTPVANPTFFYANHTQIRPIGTYFEKFK